MTTFLLIRHALHEFGAEKLAGRTSGVHLSPDGKKQAEELAVRISSIQIDAIFSSPLERTQETAAAIASLQGLKVQTREELTELDFGNWTREPVLDLPKDPLWPRFNAFRSGSRASGGEFMPEVQLRIVRLMEQQWQLHPNQTVALVSHGDVIKAAVAYWLGVPLDLFLRIEIGTGSVSVVALDDYGPWILGINHTGFLPGLPERRP